MIHDSFAFISNYVCRESIKNLNKNLSKDELNSFCYNDYYYLVAIHNLSCPNFSQIAAELEITKPAVSVLIRKFIKLGLIEKNQSEKDKRVFHVKLTEKGRKIVQGDEELYYTLSEHINRLVKNNEQYEMIDSLLSEVVSLLKK